MNDVVKQIIQQIAKVTERARGLSYTERAYIGRYLYAKSALMTQDTVTMTCDICAAPPTESNESLST